MALRKILYVCHNHPMNRAGGSEVYASELYQAVRAAGEFEPILVARTGPPMTTMDAAHQDTRFAVVGEDPNEYFLYTDRSEIDLLFGSAKDKRLYTVHWRSFLEVHKPDLVHFQHTLLLGYEMIRQTRNTLPHAPIVYTLHEFLPICHHNGQMVRAQTFELCSQASPRRCHQCFPKISTERFFLRERFIKSCFECVDLFIAPSEQLRTRYIEWGIPPEKIICEDYGRLPVPSPGDTPRSGPRNRIAYFGQLTRYKGVDVLLEAMRILAEEGTDVRLAIHGANLSYQAPDWQEKLQQLLDESSDSVRFVGGYEHARMPSLLAETDWVVVPSIWSENSPLVIQEALMHGRPVICSGVGGMAEKVRDGIDGLHFSVGDPESLAEVIRTAVSTPELWAAMRDRIEGAYPMDKHLARLSDRYNNLLERATVNSVLQ